MLRFIINIAVFYSTIYKFYCNSSTDFNCCTELTVRFELLLLYTGTVCRWIIN